MQTDWWQKSTTESDIRIRSLEECLVSILRVTRHRRLPGRSLWPIVNDVLWRNGARERRERRTRDRDEVRWNQHKQSTCWARRVPFFTSDRRRREHCQMSDADERMALSSLRDKKEDRRSTLPDKSPEITTITTTTRSKEKRLWSCQRCRERDNKFDVLQQRSRAAISVWYSSGRCAFFTSWWFLIDSNMSARERWKSLSLPLTSHLRNNSSLISFARSPCKPCPASSNLINRAPKV